MSSTKTTGNFVARPCERFNGWVVTEVLQPRYPDMRARVIEQRVEERSNITFEEFEQVMGSSNPGIVDLARKMLESPGGLIIDSQTIFTEVEYVPFERNVRART